MELLRFDLTGKFAHFRKFFSNSTALSFSIPPRTTITGMLAGILGRARDSYYEEFSPGNLRIGLAVSSPVKKVIHTTKQLIVKTPKDDFSGSGGTRLTPFEVVTPDSISSQKLIYSIYLSPVSGSGIETYSVLQDALSKNNFYFNLTMGVAFFHAFVENVICFGDAEIEAMKDPQRTVDICSAINIRALGRIDWDTSAEGKYQFVEEELMPGVFDKDRNVIEMHRLLFGHNGIPIACTYNGTVYTAGGKNIVFMDSLE